ncbi:hypothetical protein TVAG_004810 [Trichomonas vaginalis G3]|uniref:Uncharacterized protein n=1 Tax=Trichomonas vaginalis (strain ATCC PRA-98 / G3) TaxID=412133 RepID=A2DT43_TRIV3|nr:Major Facilitator Superfamily (MFS) general substrate transporter family [Trichomonas vaginalis G3]EAY16450.1 hypothetical protein TVAG_004810 [Trichomonas vaginalis G3]KAI5505685.1 Major Facilitator Superfamily (MFS) general substrate transporter family [Trichomonas vaginalis G3]|eukprot:XP_001328673.1 hypothetical protein [Trichomonas vaginalis G3]
MSAFLITNNHKPMMGFVSGTYTIISLIGAQFLSMFTDWLSNIQWWTLSAVLSGISLVCIYIFYNNKHIVFCLTSLESFFSSILLAIRMEIIKFYFPRSIRGYLVTMCRTPTLLLSYISLKILVTDRIQIFALISGILMIISSIIGLPFLMIHNNAEVLDSKTKESNEDNSIQVEEDLEEGYNLSEESTISS